MKRLRILPLVVAASVVTGCDTTTSGSDAVVQADSAGIALVTSPDRAAPEILVDTIPDLSLGGPEAEGPEAFGRVQNVVAGPDDSLWVSDRQAADIKVFNSDGSHRATVGGRGDGPGEFRIPQLLGFAGESVAVQDAGTGRITWFDLDGNLLRTHSMAAQEGRSGRVYDVTQDGRFVGLESEVLPASELSVGSTYGGDAALVIWTSPDEPPTEFTREPMARFIWNGAGATTAMPFTTNARVVAGEAIDIVAGPQFEVKRYSVDGDLVRISRIARSPIPVDANARRDFREFTELSSTGARRAAAIEALDHPELPELVGAYRGLVRGEDGSVWAYRNNPANPGGQPWDVFSADGSYRGAVTLPDSFQLTAATSDFVYGYWTDDLGVHHVRRYRLVRA